MLQVQHTLSSNCICGPQPQCKMLQFYDTLFFQNVYTNCSHSVKCYSFMTLFFFKMYTRTPATAVNVTGLRHSFFFSNCIRGPQPQPHELISYCVVLCLLYLYGSLVTMMKINNEGEEASRVSQENFRQHHSEMSTQSLTSSDQYVTGMLQWLPLHTHNTLDQHSHGKISTAPVYSSSLACFFRYWGSLLAAQRKPRLEAELSGVFWLRAAQR